MNLCQKTQSSKRVNCNNYPHNEGGQLPYKGRYRWALSAKARLSNILNAIQFQIQFQVPDSAPDSVPDLIN